MYNPQKRGRKPKNKNRKGSLKFPPKNCSCKVVRCTLCNGGCKGTKCSNQCKCNVRPEPENNTGPPISRTSSSFIASGTANITTTPRNIDIDADTSTIQSSSDRQIMPTVSLFSSPASTSSSTEKQPPPKKKRKHETNQKNTRSNIVSVPRKSKRISKMSTPRHHKPGNDRCNELNSSELCRKIIQEPDDKTQSQSLMLAKRLARKNLHPNDYYAIMEDSPMINWDEANSKVQLKQSVGPSICTTGDIFHAFQHVLPDSNSTRLKTNMGTDRNRMTNPDMAETHSRHFMKMKKVALACSSHIREVIYPANPSAFEISDRDENLPLSDDHVTILNSLVNNSKKGSLERRGIEVAMWKLDPKLIQNSIKRKQVQNDADAIENKKGLQKIRYSRQSKNSAAIHNAVKFILRADKVQHLSWGYTEFDLGDNEIVVLPNLLRCQSREHLWNDYSNTTKDKEKKDRLGRTLFIEIASNITRGGDYKAVSCVDYVLGNLVNDPVERLQLIIETIFASKSNDCVKFSEDLTKLRDFLKVRFEQHIKMEDGDGFHSLTHALTKKNRKGKCRVDFCSVCASNADEEREDNAEARDDTPKILVECHGCKFPFYFCDKLKQAVEQKARATNDISNSTERRVRTSNNRPQAISHGSENNPTTNSVSDSPTSSRENEFDCSSDGSSTDDQLDEDGLTQTHDQETNTRQTGVVVDENFLRNAKKVIDDCKEKFFYYMRHRIRVTCQRERYDKVMNDLYEDCLEYKKTTGKVFIIVDFKQKFESMSSRETMPENFGKRGMAWHGVSILFYKWTKDETDDTYKPIKEVLYMDQILDRTNKQDALSVICLIEALAVALLAQFPDMVPIEAILCSDNAGCYLSKFLLLAISIMNLRYSGKFFISSIMHTETQDGKGITDCHFAVMMRLLRVFITTYFPNKVRRINTPSGLSFALSWKGGGANSSVQLIEIDRDHIEFLKTYLEKSCTKLSHWFKQRASEIEFVKPSDDMVNIAKLIVWNDVQSIKDNLSKVTVSLRATGHSGYGNFVQFDITLGPNPQVTIDNVGKKEYDINLGLISLANDDVSDSETEGEQEDEDRETFSDHEYVYNSSEDDFCDTENDRDDDSISDDDDNSDIESTRVPDGTPYGRPTHNSYTSKGFFTQAEIVRTSYYSSTSKKKKKNNSAKSRTVRKKTKSDPKVKRNDATATAIRYSKQLIENDNLFTSSDSNDKDDKMYEESVLYHFDARKYGLESGWARRAKGGNDLFGAHYIFPYRERVRELVEQGNKQSHKKSSPAMILQILKGEADTNSKMLLLPTEHEVRGLVGSMLNSKSTRVENGDDNGTRGNTRRSLPTNAGILPLPVRYWLENIYLLDGHVNDAPMKILEATITEYGNDYSLLSLQSNSAKLRKEITAMRNKIKKDAKLDLF